MRLTLPTLLALVATSPFARAAGDYDQPLRPQFHFTAKTNWLNDPNGLVYAGNEFHLFFQHNPNGINWGNMTWGHAVSPDLFHWRQLGHALAPDPLGTMFSGSAVVDHANSAGLQQQGGQPPLVAIYTAAGDTSPESKGKPFTQCLAYSTDNGRTWTKYPHNPVLPNIAPGNRDPKVVFHAPTQRWIMALYKERSDFALLSSPDLKTWLHLQDLTIPGSDECPDFFEIPLQGTTDTRWIFTTASGRYVVGSFDGHHFTPESGPYPSDLGPNFYAVQSYSDAPGHRRIQIAWMRDGKYPDMPFNQQMSLPCDLTLRPTPAGPRLFRAPVKELESLRAPRITAPTDTPDGLDATLSFPAAKSLTLSVHGHALTYSPDSHTLTFLNRSVPIESADTVRLRLIIDRTSVELFTDDGLTVASFCLLPKPSEPSLAYTPSSVTGAEIYPLKSSLP